ncbi:MAG: POTRA domain-containing protein, partial [Sphingomicrobium sp.]
MISSSKSYKRAGALLMVGTILGGLAVPLHAQQGPESAPVPAPALPTAAPPAPPAPVNRMIRSIQVTGNQRLEAETIRAYANLAPGQPYDAASLDQALKELYATQLF